MIVFKKIRLKNFRSFGNQWAEIQLDKNPLTLISAPNGSGKSSILMGIEWCLFGKCGSLTRKEIINNVNRGECEGCLELYNNITKISYRVERGIDPNYLRLFKNDKLVPQNASVKDYQEVIDELTGLTRNVFNRTISINGSSYVPFLSLSQTARREMVENILEITELRQLNIKNNEKINSLDTEINTLRGKIEGLEHTIEKIKKDREVDDRANEAKTKELLDEMTSVLKGKSLQAMENKLQHMNLSRNMLGQKKESIKKEIEFWSKETCPTCGQPISLDLKNAHVKNSEKQVQEIEKTLQIADEEISRANSLHIRAKQLEREISNLLAVKKGNKTTDTIEDLQKTIQKITEELVKLQEKSKYHTTIKKWLKDDGIRSVIIAKYLPLFNKTLQKYLIDIGLDVSIELDKVFNATIKRRNGEERSYSSFSAGERARIDLCFLLSWKSLISSNKFVDASLLFLDEIYDSVLDAEGLYNLIEMLYNMENVNVFFISHREGISEFFQHHLRIEKDRGFTKIL